MAYQIEVKQIKPFPVAEFEVKVSGKSQTTHIVSLEENYFKKLTEGKITAEKLVYLSFEFLLDREPNTSILKRFNLREINHYFPEYENEIVTMF
ncbi:hypothetical protein JGI7_00787 [Candidatus Kryptonium thompsonii]|jgi:hypothetical protein|uniref:Uncharacterized protein n=1 Tax=Candidatus Kryptonium thompsonii TaxID=1633631 RepID=A0A0P1LUC6_9BACT|nr:hypothetical protein [Candidatus Kryptonium thompsoni]CUS84267.1 hypothetical protein JGI7_00787 [Candidatus Kryptonium thompsoni]CUS85632.1 hypothetical protein JGI12_00892 [Candidatus Kryptonium thompsoni]CUS85860.1 hypothetical protein JGI14_102220 [Candidatus Kryptonium thompsoni]CUS86649.1 hypothetical protein JGI15_103210 [Candidatus Kryptonium thompsoni]CUS87397.1 hypothetical protein JGI13_01441 [Candidatus Kryptonium thompsoni]